LKKIVRQMENSDSQTIFHSSTVIENLFEILGVHSGMHLEPRISVFAQFWYGHAKSINMFGNVSWNIVKQSSYNDFPYYFPFFYCYCKLVWHSWTSFRNALSNKNKVFSHYLYLDNPNPSRFVVMLQGTLSSKWKTVISILFCIFLLLLQTCFKFLNYIQECTCYLQ